MFKALVDPNDEFHNNAEDIWKRLASADVELVTSNYILDESYTLIRARCGIQTVQEFRQTLNSSTAALTTVRVTSADESAAWDWFCQDWSKLSFTDCVSFAIMKRYTITRAAAFDHHFEQAGFILEK